MTLTCAANVWHASSAVLEQFLCTASSPRHFVFVGFSVRLIAAPLSLLVIIRGANIRYIPAATAD